MGWGLTHERVPIRPTLRLERIGTLNEVWRLPESQDRLFGDRHSISANPKDDYQEGLADDQQISG
jgi:hypothetical protein